MASHLPISADTFIDKWWTNLSSPIGFDLEEWIKTTYTTPEKFWEDAVFSRQEKYLPPSKSLFSKSYDFYHDCVLRHIKTNKIAFSLITKKNDQENWSYKRIHQCVNYHIDKWSSFSPQPKQVVAIVGEPNVSFVISLFAALRLGLVIYYFPTNSPYLGKGKIHQFLSAIKPNLIAAEDPSFSVEGIPHLVVNLEALDEDSHSDQSYAYSANSEINISLSMQESEAISFKPMDAQTIYLRALRDGFFTLNLIQNSFWSAPLSCPIRSEPFSTIASMLCGATRVHVPDDILKIHPQIILNERIQLIGISRALTLLWTKNPGVPYRHLKYVYKNPLEFSYQVWKTFAQLNEIEKVPTIDLIFDQSSGGIPIFSRPTFESYNAFIKPGLGEKWSLTPINGSQEPSESVMGLFNISSPTSQKQHSNANIIASKLDDSLILTGCELPCKEGTTFPIDEVEECVNALSYVDVCMVHPVMKIGYPFNQYFVLIVFVNPNVRDIANQSIIWLNEIQRKISFELGSGFLPDHIEFLPLVPKMNLLGIDRNWCAHQYQSGMLMQKKNLNQYKLIGMLKKLVHDVLADT